MKKLLPFITACLIASAAAAAGPSTPPLFQIRLVVDTPSGDSEPMALIRKNQDHAVTNMLNVQKTILLDQKALKSAKASQDALGQPVIYIYLTDAGAKQFAEVTRQNVNQRLAVLINGQVCQAPRIRTEIPGGKFEISGTFNKQEARDLANQINGVLTKE